MSNACKFKLNQNKEDKTLTLEFWTRYGEKPDDWINVEKFEGMTIMDLKELRDYINKVCNKNLI